MDDCIESNYLKMFGNLFKTIFWGIGAMVLGGLLSGWMGATIALSIMCYWRMCTMTAAIPLMTGLSKAIEKLGKKETINQTLIQDLEEIRSQLDELREEFENFQLHAEKRRKRRHDAN